MTRTASRKSIVKHKQDKKAKLPFRQHNKYSTKPFNLAVHREAMPINREC